MDISARFGDVSARMRDIASRGKAMLKPPPIVFGAPRQTSTDPALSWWHIQIFIQPTALHRKELEQCKVWLAPTDGSSTPLRMCWRNPDSTAYMHTATLEAGRLYLVPVAARKESGKRAGIITNEGFFAEKKAKWTMRPGRTAWTIRLQNEEGKWESPHSYVLTVPKPDQANGHFVLDVRYDDLN